MAYGTPEVHPTAKIASNATVVGDVHIAEDVTVLYGAVLRGDMGGHVRIGARSNIQELACLHVPIDGDVVVGEDVSVGHGAILHGCTIGDGSLVGMGAIVLDGATIGKRCLIGAGALVTGKMDAPDGVLIVGSPAKVARDLTEEELASLTVNCQEYVSIGRTLAEEGLL